MLRAAVIGVGYLGKFHAEKFAKSKKANLVAVVDSDLAVARKFAKKFRAEALTDYRELVSLGVDCLSVATPTTTHFEISRWALENGIDVMVEKPMTATVEEGQQLVSIARDNQRILQVGHLERFNPAFQAVRDRLTSPRFFEVRRIAPFSGRGHDVDVVQDLMIHDIDIVAHLVGRPLKRVEAVGIPVLTSTVDIANARITFEGGAVANFSASRAAFATERTIRIFQPNVYISLDYQKKKLKICTRMDSRDEKGFPKIDLKEMKVEERDALAQEIDSFLEVVRTRGVPEVTGDDGLRALELAEQIRDAFAESMQAMSEDEGFSSLQIVENF